MELKIYSPNEDGFIKAINWNNEELKQELTEKVKHYETVVYTDDEIQVAKKDRATLNAFVKAIEDKRKEIKKQCLEPYDKFETEVKDLLSVVRKPIDVINTQIKEYEDTKKQEKLEEIKKLYTDSLPPTMDWLTFEKCFNEKWLNATYSIKKIGDELSAGFKKVEADLKTIEMLPAFSFEAQGVYKKTLDLNQAISKGQELADIQKRKEEFEAKKKEEEAKKKAEEEAKAKEVEELPQAPNYQETFNEAQPEPMWYPGGSPESEFVQEELNMGQWIKFMAYMTVEQALELKEFFKSRSIVFKPVEK
jgi:uncharacterized phage infection (PIP) family protein YhgE